MFSNLEHLKLKAWGHKQHFSQFLPVNKKSQIVDLGCGNGSLIYWLTTEGYENVVGYDLSIQQISQGKQLGIENIFEKDVFEILQSEKKFDLIFARDLLEHFTKEEALRFLNLCSNRLNPHGVLILQIPNAGSPFFGRTRYGDFTHEIAFTQSSLSQIIKSTFESYSRISFYPWQPVVISFRSLVRYCVWRVFEFFYKIPLWAEHGGFNHICTINLIAVVTK